MAERITDAGEFGDRAPDRYAGLVLGDGTVLVLDREEPDGWLRSDVAVDLQALQ